MLQYCILEIVMSAEESAPQNEWSDQHEHTLDMIRLNSANLSEHHYTKYEQYKRRLNYVKYPVIGMSAVNAYAALGLPQYISQQYVSIGNTVVSFAVVIIVLLDLFLGTQKKIEDELTKYIEYKHIGKDIYEVLKMDRENRKIDPGMFLTMKYKLYETLSDSNEKIMKFKDYVVSKTDDFMSLPMLKKDDPIVQKLHKHWNILFQPITLKLQEIVKPQESETQEETSSTGTNTTDIGKLEDIYHMSEEYFHKFSQYVKNPFEKIGQRLKQTKEDKPSEEKKDPESGESKIELTENPAKVEPTSPKSPESEKKFTMNFMNKV